MAQAIYMRRRRLRRKGEMENERRKPLTTAARALPAHSYYTSGGRQASCVRERQRPALYGALSSGVVTD